MRYNPQIHHRRSIRLKKYDYGQQGAYFITICTHNKQCWFGEIHNSQMYLNQFGKIVAQEWLRTAEIRPEVVLGEWIIMPNHVHGIIAIDRNSQEEGTQVIDFQEKGEHDKKEQIEKRVHIGALQVGRRGKSLSSIVAGFKSVTTKRVNILREMCRVPLWQRNYYESVVRNCSHLERIKAYIRANPSDWSNDPEYSRYDSINSWDLPF
ncbi:MAG: transposase [Cyanobacteria bacterium J06639_18]